MAIKPRLNIGNKLYLPLSIIWKKKKKTNLFAFSTDNLLLSEVNIQLTWLEILFFKSNY